MYLEDYTFFEKSSFGVCTGKPWLRGSVGKNNFFLYILKKNVINKT